MKKLDLVNTGAEGGGKLKEFWITARMGYVYRH